LYGCVCQLGIKENNDDDDDDDDTASNQLRSYYTNKRPLATCNAHDVYNTYFIVFHFGVLVTTFFHPKK